MVRHSLRQLAGMGGDVRLWRWSAILNHNSPSVGADSAKVLLGKRSY